MNDHSSLFSFYLLRLVTAFHQHQAHLVFLDVARRKLYLLLGGFSALLFVFEDYALVKKKSTAVSSLSFLLPPLCLFLM